jgi:hypothetical protein
MYPPPWLRASDADREVIVAHLSASAVDGRLTLDEFADRTQRVYASHTWGELAYLVGDLPRLPATNRKAATASRSMLPPIALILGIMSIPATAWVPVGWVLGVVAILLAILGLRAAAAGTVGRGLAIAGLTCGAFGVFAQATLIGLLALV